MNPVNLSVIVAPDKKNFLSADSNCPEKVTSARESDPLALNVVGSGSSIMLL